MMGRFRSTRFAQRFFLLSPSQGERIKVRGLNELALNQSSPSPSPLTRRGDPHARISSFETNMSSVKVHPTAIVDPNAKLGAHVEIGPFSIIGSHVTIGENTIVQSHVVIESDVAIGRGNFIGHGAIIGAPPQDVSFSPERNTKVEIGDNNIIREYLHGPPR